MNAEQYVATVVNGFTTKPWGRHTPVGEVVANGIRLDLVLDLELLADIDIRDDQMMAWNTVGDIIQTVEQKLENRI